jgi:drug/metabolite transporter (DMT)-like permease
MAGPEEKPQQKCTTYLTALAIGMLITGSINTILSKIIYEWGEAPGCCGYTIRGAPNTLPHKFQHPWFQTWVMFVGECLCVIPFVYKRCMKKRERANLGSFIGGSTKKIEVGPSPFSHIFAIPAACDLTASTLGSVALLWIPASIWQMMRGANIIFVGILSVIFLKARLGAHKWFGLFIVVTGLVLVGLSGFFTDDSVGDNKNELLFIIGIVLVLGAQIIAAAQSIIEEVLLKDSGYDPLNVVFMEGFWGVSLLTLFGLPLAFILPGQTPVRDSENHTINPVIQIYSDNALDAFVQISNFAPFLVVNIGIVFAIAFFNFFGLVITSKLTAVHRNLIDACRTIFIWATQIIFGWVGFPSGEHLSYYSFIQLGGFILLVLGTLIYNDVIKLPFFTYPVDENEKKKLLN